MVQIYKKALAGVMPLNLHVLRLGWPEAYEFVMRCLQVGGVCAWCHRLNLLRVDVSAASAACYRGRRN